jgi:hypothetical protein
MRVFLIWPSTWRGVICALLVLVFSSGCTDEKPQPNFKRALIAEILEEMDHDRYEQRNMEMVLREWQRNFPDVPASFWNDELHDITSAYAKAEREVFVQAYERGFSEDDLQEVLRFYHSPVGRRMKQFSQQMVSTLRTEILQPNETLNDQIKARLKQRGYL